MKRLNRLLTSNTLRPALPTPLNLNLSAKAAPGDIGCYPFSASSHGLTVTANLDSEALHRYTSGRWLWDEELRLKCRRVEFNVAELKALAASAVGSQACVGLKKLPEGSFNKAFLLSMDDGKEIIAKLPNPNAGHKHFTTASEAATMEYARRVLELPVPHVYNWSSSTANSVGAEYILMEKCRGVELHKVWDRITDRQKAAIIRKLVGYENTFASSKLPMYGSLYYAKNLSVVDQRQRVPLDPIKDHTHAEYAVGPSTDRDFFDHHRSCADVYRGPWSHLEEYNVSIAQRELACLEKSSQFPDPQGFFNGPGQFRQSSKLKTEVLESFKKVAKYLVPQDPLLSRAVLWHTDLHSDNIFVDEEDPTEITAIIDWQAVHIGPLFSQARHPKFLEFDGEIPEGFDSSAIKLPENFTDLSEEEQEQARKLRGAQLLWKIYELELACQCDDVDRALRFGKSLIPRLITLAGNVFSDGELLLQDLLIQLQEQWDQLVDDPIAEPCPLAFTEEDQVTHSEQFALWAQSLEAMAQFLSRMGGFRGWDGWVSHDQYDLAKKKMRHFKEEFIAHNSSTDAEKEEWMRAWPFKD